jgi:N-methylhydantoinase B
MRSGNEWLLNAIPSRLNSGAEGLFGAGSGAPGQFLVNNEACSEAKKMVMNADDQVLMRTPGGGGSGRL